MRTCSPRLLAAVLPLLLAACSEPAAEEAAQAVKPQQPETAFARAAEDAPLGTVPATVILPPAARVAVTAPFAGVVRQVHVIEGEEVRAGQLLATISSREAFALASERARASARLELAEASAARISQLAREGVVAGARADEAQAALREARVDRAEADRVLARGGASANGSVRLLAPIAGRVSRVAVETGGPLDGMTAPFVIDAANRYSLSLQLPERLAGRVRPGMAVLVPGGGRGRIMSVAPGLDPATRSISAIASIGAAPGLIAGSSLTVTIAAPAGSGAVAVPSAALTRMAGKDIVFVSVPKGFKAQPVLAGASADGETVILDGLQPGARVAISGLPELKSAAGG